MTNPRAPEVLTTAPIEEELARAYRFFNRELLLGVLRARVAVTVQTRGGKWNRLGWHAESRWKARKAGKLAAEINVAAESLGRPVEEILETLLHEMAHHYSHERKIQDTSRSGVYHNRRYKDAAEKVGLVCVRTPDHGWAATRLGPRAKEAIRKLNAKEEVFSMTRVQDRRTSRAAEGASTRDKWICGCPRRSVWAAAEIDLTCNECGKKLHKV